jgi:hypothetical protein
LSYSLDRGVEIVAQGYRLVEHSPDGQHGETRDQGVDGEIRVNETDSRLGVRQKCGD